MTPYYEDRTTAIFHCDWSEVLVHPALEDIDVIVTDPPYGIDYDSGSRRREGHPRSIEGDLDTKQRDDMLMVFAETPALVFGSPRRSKPAHTKGTLVWDKGGALGMGDLTLPWRFDHEEIYIIGAGWVGKREQGSVIRHPPEQSVGRIHPHQKPVTLITKLLAWCPPGTVFDPFMGSGSTLVAAKAVGRRAIGVEVNEAYCEAAAMRVGQEVLDFGGAA